MSEHSAAVAHPHPALSQLAALHHFRTYVDVGVVVVVLLLLIAGGLVGASVALNQDHSPDPRPLLEKLYRQYIKGEAAPAPAPAPAKKSEAEPAKSEPAAK